ncbi:hypothetical protein Peur_004048 [Populus x canadensis]
MGNDSESPNELWTEMLGALVGITGYVSYAPALIIRQLGGMQFVPRTMGIAQFLGLFKDPIAQEVLEIIKRDWKHLVLVEIEGLKDPSASEGYASFSHALYKRRAFLDEQTQSRDARITKLELKLSEEKIVRKEVRRS